MRTCLVVLVIAFAATGFYGCKNTSQSPSSSSPAQPQTEFERDLQYVRNGQFTYVFVFTRPDGAAFTAEDIAYLKANSPPETNQWVSTDAKRRIIAGTHFEFKPEHLEALRQRFVVEDYAG